jgi:hypothetical protein
VHRERGRRKGEKAKRERQRSLRGSKLKYLFTLSPFSLFAFSPFPLFSFPFPFGIKYYKIGLTENPAWFIFPRCFSYVPYNARGGSLLWEAPHVAFAGSFKALSKSQSAEVIAA